MADLSITALYTAETWAWGGFACAELFTSREGKAVFDATNATLALARRVRSDLAPLRESLVQRHALIDRLARDALDARARDGATGGASGDPRAHGGATGGASGDPRAGAGLVIELAAGLSPRGAAFTQADPALRYVEIDLPAMIERKRALLARTEAGRAVLARTATGRSAHDRPTHGQTGLSIVPGDVATVDLAAHAPPPTVVIAEGLFMYLDAAAQAALFTRIRALASTAAAGDDVTLIFDLVPSAEEPPPGRVGRALGRALARATGGQDFIRDGRTRADVLAALAAAGFTDARALDTRAVARDYALPHPDAPTRMVVFTARARATRP